MVDFSRLSANWYRWAPGMGGGDIYVTTDCPDCLISFRTDDYSVHLRKDGEWWIVDTVNDRGQRHNNYAKLSNFDLTEKYLIWDWATTARSDLASGPLGADLARLGYAPDVKVSKVDGGYEICMNADCAILSVVNATIFSHLMSKSVEEIEQMVTLGPG
jgi:hypothetical protein